MGKKEEAEVILIRLRVLGQRIEEMNKLNNKVRSTVVKDYIPGAEGLANAFVSEASMEHFQKSARLAQEIIHTTNEISKWMQYAAESAQRIAIADLKAKGISIKE